MRKAFRVTISLFLAAALLTLSASAAFPDVKRGSWYEECVNDMAAKGILTGMPDGRFHPDDIVSTSEFVTIAARCVQLSPGQSSVDHWAAGTMEAARLSGWFDWDEIPPDAGHYSKPISRQLAVKVLMRALLPLAKGDYNTQKAKINDFATINGRYYESVLAAYEWGVVKGDGNGDFRPASSLTRAEACALFQRAMDQAGAERPEEETPQQAGSSTATAVQTIGGGAAENGWLQVKKGQLCNEYGSPIVLKGMSSHGLQWYGQYAVSQSIQNTAAFGANVFRVAMYTDQDGYLSNPDTIQAKAIAAVDAAIENDMYVILDWHILHDGDPMAHVDEAERFFTEMAARYRDCPNVIYEICNEPNGNVTWGGNIKPYAERIIPVIRAQSPYCVILVGSSTWSQDIHLAAADPLRYDNIMYTLHFYAGTHGQELRKRIDDARKVGLPIFVSEWGTSAADGNGGVFLAESMQWVDFMAQRGISWCNWSLCDKEETSAALKPGTPPDRAWTPEDLSESGVFVFSRFGQ